MADNKTIPPPANSGFLSRSGIGRATGRVSQLFGGSSTVQATGRFLRQQLWVWPIIAAVIVALAGWFVSSSVERAMHEKRRDELTTILNADVAALRVWMADQRTIAGLVASDEQLRPLIEQLLAVAQTEGSSERELVQSDAQAGLRARLKDALARGGYSGFFVVAPSGVILAADQDPPIGKPLAGYRKEVFDKALSGQAVVSKPYRSTLLLTDDKGEMRANLPTMFTAAPVRDAEGKPVAALGLRIRPDDQFTKILQVAQSGQSGETYAFDRQGLLLSQSRFDDQLKQIALLVDQPEVQSILTLELRDPGVDLTLGERPTARRTEQPLTRMAAAAVAGEDGYDVAGYRDYRGVPVIGAWQWLPDLDFSVATEIDVAEGFRALYILRRAFWGLMTLLALAAVAIFVGMLFMAKQQKALQQATLAAKQLGQYRLEDKLGSGGMGTVYKARHAMLRRPTAVKLLDIDKMSDAAVVRFEREVQLTSALTHPNTVSVFDFGRTPEGIFYYAMEYLEGINLDDLVARFGPLSEARVVYLLRQVCGSLAEAHGSGLVHRDIKPANIFLTCRGAQYDFVKVLDFGLVKALEGEESTNVTSANAIAGTPLYLSPEQVNQPDQVDARTDVYAIGAVGYYLLTGTPVFKGTSVMEICMKHIQEMPESPSARLKRPLAADLEALILRCLAKQPDERPASAAELLVTLDACHVEGRWTAAEAAQWWRENDPTTVSPRRHTPDTVPSAPAVTSPQMTAIYDGDV